MDLRAKTMIASFLGLFGLLALTAFASIHHAEPNSDLTTALFGPTH